MRHDPASIAAGEARRRRTDERPAEGTKDATDGDRRAVDLVRSAEDQIRSFHGQASRQWITGTSVLLMTLLAISQLCSNLLLLIPVSTFGLLILRKKLEGVKHEYRWDAERRTVPVETPDFESVEWLNAAVSSVWPTLDPDLFIAGIDLLEEALKSVSPSIVRTASVTNFDQGSNAPRILGIRRLNYDIERNAPLDSSGITGIDESSQFANIEAKFAWVRRPHGGEATQASFRVHMGLGVKGVAKVDVPVSVELTGLHGIVQFRLELTSDPPFVRHIKFSFPTLPNVSIAAKPLGLLDVMTLPGANSYILSAINSVFNYFVAPRSYTIDLSRFLIGSDVAMSTDSIGVVCVLIHRAETLVRDEVDEARRTIVQVALENGKDRSSTRPQAGSHPVWEQMIVVRIAPEHIENEDAIRLTLFDQRPSQPDNSLGQVSTTVTHLYDAPGEWTKETATMRSGVGGAVASGTLSYSAAFFPLSSHTSEPPKTATEAADGQPRDEEVPYRKSRPTYANRGQTEESRSGAYAQRMREMLDGRLPAAKSQPTGILAFRIHQLAELDYGSRKGGGHSGKKTPKLPSTYCCVFLNDEKVFQTRSKPLSLAPYFNSGSETFCPDWVHSRLDVAIMDNRGQDADILLGFVSVPLREILSQRSQITKWYPFHSGAAKGRLRLSLLFKSLDIVLPSPSFTWNMGVVEIVEARTMELDSTAEQRLTVQVDERTYEAHLVHNQDAANSAPSLSAPLQVPVLSRLAPLHLLISRQNSTKTTSAKLSAVLILQTLALSTGRTVTVALQLIPSSISYYPPSLPLPSLPHHPLPPTLPSPSPPTGPALQLTLRFIPGISALHREIVLDSKDEAQKAAYQLWLVRDAAKKRAEEVEEVESIEEVEGAVEAMVTDNETDDEFEEKSKGGGMKQRMKRATQKVKVKITSSSRKPA